MQAEYDMASARFELSHAPVRVIDTAVVAAGRVQEMLAVIRDEIVPVMEEAGARLGSCLATSAEIGEDVIVQTTWLVEDHAAWNVIRKNCFLDPRWHAGWARAAAIRLASDRRFFYPVPIGGEG